MTDSELLPDNLLLDWTLLLRTGERGDEVDKRARQILRDFVMRQSSGKLHSPVTLDWLAGVFDAVLDHADPREALGLQPRPNHRPREENPIDVDVAMWLRAAEQRGYSHGDAVGLAAEQFSRDTKTGSSWKRVGDLRA